MTLTVTTFAKSGSGASEGARYELTWEQVCVKITKPAKFTSKGEMRLISFAKWPDDSRRAGSVPEAIFAVVGDYDEGVTTVEEAEQLLKKHGIRSLIYTSASHTPQAPRWRVVVPLESPVTPDQYPGLVSRLNGALGGILATESWEPARCYFFGRVVPEYKVAMIEPAQGSDSGEDLI